VPWRGDERERDSRVDEDRKNELHKLAATFFNNIAVGCVLLGLIARLASLKISLAVKADSPSPSGLCAKPLGLVLKE
jgi:hypothetical protein